MADVSGEVVGGGHLAACGAILGASLKSHTVSRLRMVAAASHGRKVAGDAHVAQGPLFLVHPVHGGSAGLARIRYALEAAAAVADDTTQQPDELAHVLGFAPHA